MLRPVQSMRALPVVGLLVATALYSSALSAQVGHLPARTPYEDLKPTQDLTIIAGHLGTSVGPAGVAPKPAAFFGVRYDVPVGGPASLTGRYMLVGSERSIVLPTKPEAERFISTTNTTLHAADVGITIALTGRKTWHRLVPSLSGGVGLVSNFAKADTGGYHFGTKFALTGGGNVRYVLRNRWSLRFDATNYFWQDTYPDSYLVPASDGKTVLKNTRQRNEWSGNWALSLGLAIPIVR